DASPCSVDPLSRLPLHWGLWADHFPSTPLLSALRLAMVFGGDAVLVSVDLLDRLSAAKRIPGARGYPGGGCVLVLREPADGFVGFFGSGCGLLSRSQIDPSGFAQPLPGFVH